MSFNSEEQKDVEPPVGTLNVEEIEYETETSRKNVFFWAMYDLANTIYSMIIVSLIINKYVLVIGQLEYGLSYGTVSFIFGVVSFLMQIGVAISVPILGALSDNVRKAKTFCYKLNWHYLSFCKFTWIL